MTKRLAIPFILLCLLIGSLPSYNGKIVVYNHHKFLEEIRLPIDTSDPASRYYPMDIRVNFSHPCWAEDEMNRSVRVIVYHDGNYREIESQIYDLEFVNRNLIKSCNIVFLIPDFADGSERYFVTYSSEPVQPPIYTDHLSIKEGRFYYEPIRGYKADVKYYMIEEDGFIPFLVCYDGSVTGIRFPQRVVKLKEGSRSLSLNNWLVATTYALIYLDDSKPLGSIGSMEKLISKKVIIDGNIMVRFGIETESFDGNLITRNLYTYYYSPVNEKRMVVHSSQKVMEGRTSRGVGAQGGNIVTMITSIVRSVNIEELNTGLYIPYVHFLSEENIVKEYRFPREVTKGKQEWIILPKDDEDLGEKPWISMDFGERGDTFALIFTNTNPFSKGREGLQITAGASKWIDIPGLLIEGMGISVGRNSFERGEEEILSLPSDLEANFVSEFYYTPYGYKKVEKEAGLFGKIFLNVSEKKVWDSEKEERKKTHNLTIIPTIQGLSHPLLATLSKFPIPLVSIELYSNDTMVSSALARRSTLMKFREIPKNLEDVFRSIYIDAKNFSIFQQVDFPELEEGRYVVKIYFKFGNLRKFVGLRILDLKDDETIIVFCKPEVEVRYIIRDQYGEPIEGIELNTIKDGEIVEKGYTDRDGKIIIKLPLSNYDIEAYYKGIKLFHDGFKSKDFLPSLFINFNREIHLYSLGVEITDSLGFDFSDRLYLNLNGIEPDFIGDSYVFTRIPRGNYTLRLLYKSFELEEYIDINSNKRIVLEIPVNQGVQIHVRDLIGREERGILLKLYRDGRKILESENMEDLQIPPGKYKIEIFKGNRLITSRNIAIYQDSQFTFFIDKSPFEIYIFLTISISITVLMIFIRKKFDGVFLLLSIFLMIFSLSLPIWELVGVKENLKVDAKLYLISNKFFIFKAQEDLYWGEATDLPDIVGSAFDIIILLISLDVFMIILHISWPEHRVGKITPLLSILIDILVVFLTYIITSTILSLSVGSTIGYGNITYNFPRVGEVDIPSVWFLGKGFLLILLAICPKLFYFLLYKRNVS